jgi:hypothetical protein
LECLEIYFFDAGDGGDEDACKTGRGHVVDNACHDHEHEENTEDSGVHAAGGWQRRRENGEAGFEFREADMRNLGIQDDGMGPFL